MSALVALVVLPSLAPDLASIACPHHAGHRLATSSVPTGQPDGHGSHGTADGHPVTATSGPTADGAGDGTTHHEAPPPCTCAGECPVSQTPAGPAAHAQATADPTPPIVDPGSVPGSAPHPLQPRYRQPPANGPPLA